MTTRFSQLAMLLLICAFTAQAEMTEKTAIPERASPNALEAIEPEFFLVILTIGGAAMLSFGLPYVLLNGIFCLINYPSIEWYDVQACLTSVENNDTIVAVSFQIISIYTLVMFFAKVIFHD
ncbi:MAG: hypothetical protein V2I33_20395 [Kangiellaceae bacterium]|nr:hypothetical protein [Kangiellaceae bacterium]